MRGSERPEGEGPEAVGGNEAADGNEAVGPLRDPGIALSRLTNVYPEYGLAFVSGDTDPRALALNLPDDFPCEFFIADPGSTGFSLPSMLPWIRSCFLPMSLDIGGSAVFTPKLHVFRCVLDPGRCVCTGTTLKRSRAFGFGIDLAFGTVLARCVAAHGDDWLSAPLVAAFEELHSRPETGVRALSFEVYESGRLVAGEIGLAAGSLYASLTGFHDVDGAGSVQLAATASVLVGAGIGVWDLGMEIPYKRALGAGTLRRSGYVPLFLAAMDGAGSEAIPGGETVGAFQLVEGARARSGRPG